MTVFTILQLVVLAAAVVFLGLTVRSQFETQRFYDVMKAQNQRRDAYDALAAANRSGADPEPAHAAVAVAESRVQETEARLPRRSKNTRAYFASKKAP